MRHGWFHRWSPGVVGTMKSAVNSWVVGLTKEQGSIDLDSHSKVGTTLEASI